MEIEYNRFNYFSVKNYQFMIQFYNKYNQQLTNTKRPVSQLTYPNSALPVRQLS